MKKTVSVFVSVLLLAALLQSWAMKESHPATGGRSELNVATFNLRMDTEKDGVNAWPNRKEMVKGLIRFHDFDIFGTQEGFKHMLGNFWFSETPDVPGKGWDATCCNRICSWGKFRDKESGKVFYFFNSHYDHQGKVARRESSKLLIARIKQIAGTDATVFATGDFNAVPTDEPMVTLASDGLLLDSYDLSEQPRYGTEGTYNSFKTDSEMMNRIDYIWVTKGTKVKKYAVLNDMQYGRFPSDHFPGMIQVTF